MAASFRTNCSLSRVADINGVVCPVLQEDARRFFVAATSRRPSALSHRDLHLSLEGLVHMAESLHLSDYSEEVLRRVYECIPKDERGCVGLPEFRKALAAGGASATLRNLIHKHALGTDFGFEVPADYDFSKSTNANYKAATSDTFFGEFKELRKSRDYNYHVNYVEERQGWQDAAIKLAIGRTARQAAPWLVYTCGPMGVGKGFALNWMSKKGIFPLENIVHVDPDAFKLMMPEWSQYVAQASEEAGTLCHMESCFMMEIAQEAAMGLRQNIWVDGSLRNADFYASQFQDIRQRQPHYRIAIFYVAATEQTIRERIERRAAATGRSVPENLIRASLQAMDHSLNELTPLCDFVARINNEGCAPILKAFETINTSGSWEVVSSRFARVAPLSHEFPNALAPFALVAVPEGVSLEFRPIAGDPHYAEVDFAWQAWAQGANSASVRDKFRQVFPGSVKMGVTSPAPVTLPQYERQLAGISAEASSFNWIYPRCGMTSQRELEARGWSREEANHPIVHLLLRGGFRYMDAKGRTVQISAVANADGQGFLQFGPRRELPDGVSAGFCSERWHPPPRRYKEADAYAWLAPGEVVGDASVGGEFGAFAFRLPSGLVAFSVMV
uniref:Zeta toxin domain-containing protein n=1 Tax=Zooxanthella nutricula TaxID=1333877 RepID=A0A7S2PK64_9DINO